MKSSAIWARMGAALLVIGLAGCKTGEKRACLFCKSDKPCTSCKSVEKSLYVRLGGEKAIAAVVDDFVPRTAANPAVNFTRAGTGKEWAATPENVAHMKKMLIEFIASATGGPQKYSGRDMKSLHQGMKITSAEFDALAGDLAASLDALKVPAKEKDELMTIAASVKGDVVE